MRRVQSRHIHEIQVQISFADSLTLPSIMVYIYSYRIKRQKYTRGRIHAGFREPVSRLSKSGWVVGGAQ